MKLSRSCCDCAVVNFVWVLQRDLRHRAFADRAARVFGGGQAVADGLFGSPLNGAEALQTVEPEAGEVQHVVLVDGGDFAGEYVGDVVHQHVFAADHGNAGLGVVRMQWLQADDAAAAVVAAAQEAGMLVAA